MNNPKRIPRVEVRKLVSTAVDEYEKQFNKTVDRSKLICRFIPARVHTRFGFEIETTIERRFLNLRIYGHQFTNLPKITPYLMEYIQGNGTGYDIQSFVTISDLAVSDFPVLSTTTNPFHDDSAGPYAIELEDLSGFIKTEDNEFIVTEDSPE